MTSSTVDKFRHNCEFLEPRLMLTGSATEVDDGVLSSADIVTAPAFPGAEGFGAQTIGGRGGRVIEVTNLNDDGPGSLRSAVEAEGARIVVFRVSGTIELEESLKIENPFLTIAGQSAPGDGITLKGYELRIRTHDVIIRYLRIRIGPTANEDAVQLLGAENVILDHNSFSWATDENASATAGSRNITFQWNLITEGLNNSTHSEGSHSKGSLLSGSTNLSVHHNLFAHNDARNPRIGSSDNSYGIQVADVVNNVIYNWGTRATEVKDFVNANIVGNYYKLGPSSVGYTEDDTPEVMLHGSDTDRSLFVEGNYGPTCPTGCADNWNMVGESDGDAVSRVQQSTSRHPAPLVTTSSAQMAFDQVLAEAGAILPDRDAVDERVISDVINGTGQLIDDPAEVGGWPTLASSTPPVDSDHDGAPDQWEILYGFNPNEPADGSQDADGDGYTNVEEFLNNTIPLADLLPVALDDAATTSTNAAVTIPVLDNDQFGNHPTVITQVTQPSNGTVTNNPGEGTTTYSPNQDFSGDDSYTYTITDADGQVSTATVNVTVVEQNGPPQAANDNATTDEDTAINIDVLANDTDPNGDPLTVGSVTQATSGTVVVNSDQTVRYTPNANFSGQDSFTYVVTDDRGASQTAAVTIVVNPSNDAPVANDDSATTEPGVPVTVDVLENDHDIDGDAITVSSVTQGTDGTVTINSDGTVRYTPDPNFNGSDSFTYVVEDAKGETDSATVIVTVNAVNNRPVARDDSGVTSEENAVSIAVLNNDTDADGDALTVQSVTQASGGTVTVNANEIVRYSPNTGFSGTDSFEYTIADGRGGTDTASVSVRVIALDRDDIVSLADKTLYVARSTGDAFVTHSFGTTDANWTDTRKGDVNGDAIDDLVGRSGDTLWVARSTGQAFELETWGMWSDRISWPFFDLADVDGDGAADVVGRTQGGDWWVGKSTGTSFVNQNWGAWSSSVEWQDVNVADVNGDGRSDIVGRGKGRWWVAASTGTSFTNELWGAWSRRAVWKNVQVADVDGNGMDDIVGMTRGQWWIARSNGASFVNEFWGAWSRKAEWIDVRIGDFDGDGLDDIAGRTDGRWWIARSTGTTFVNEQWGQWSTAVSWADVIVGDFDGDGRHDIAGRTGSRWWLARSSGVSFTNELWERLPDAEAWRDVMSGEFAV